MRADLLTRDEALARLGVKAATLYAYASRGLVRRVAHEDSRRSLYAREDIERLGAKGRGRRARGAVAETAMRWGEPVISTSITHLGEQGPVYRNRPALELARSGAVFETVLHFLLTGMWQPGSSGWPAVALPPALLALAGRGRPSARPADIDKTMSMLVIALGMDGQGEAEMREGRAVPSARLVARVLAGCFGFLGPRRAFVRARAGETIAGQVLRAAGAAPSPQALGALNAALVVLADHELAAATFAARVAASTACDLYNCIAVGICSHAGRLAGTATQQVEDVLFNAPARRASLIPLIRNHGASLFGFNHPLYPHGDPRADFILDRVAGLPSLDARAQRFLALIEEARGKASAAPGIAVALVALARGLGMPPNSAGALWILSRSAGWMAHVLEQRAQAFMLRPRARYVRSLTG